MLKIRLSRIGKKNMPMYRLIISEASKDPYGRALEILGSWNPHSKELVAKNDRINHWISKGAQMSPTVNNLLIDKGVVKGEKVTASKRGEPKKTEEAPASSAPAKTEAPAESAKPAETEVKEEQTEDKKAE